MKIYISSDHGGFKLKKQITAILKSQFEVEDLGPFTLDPNDDYPLFANSLAKKVSLDKNSLGILICRSGSGVAIAANKVKGSYAAVCFTPHHAQMARHDDGANILCLDADYLSLEQHKEIITQFISTEFAGFDTRHGRRLEEIKKIEEENMK